MGLGLDQITDLSGLLAPKQQGPMEINLNLIDEDPDQPRKYFDSEGLDELASTIKERGIKTPISLRPSSIEGRYLINHGARRYRAARNAGLTTIPAFVDTNYSEIDQLIENIQRDNLTSREVAEFVGKMINKGIKKKDLAKMIGKSPAYISQHVTLLDLPEPLGKAFNDGRCQDVTVLNDLASLYKSHPKEVADLVADETQDLTRGAIKTFKEYLFDAGGAVKDTIPKTPEDSLDNSSVTTEAKEKQKTKTADPDPEKLKKAIVQVEIDGRVAQLLLNKRPSEYGSAWLKYEDDGEEFEGALSQVTVIAIIEG